MHSRARRQGAAPAQTPAAGSRTRALRCARRQMRPPVRVGGVCSGQVIWPLSACHHLHGAANQAAEQLAAGSCMRSACCLQRTCSILMAFMKRRSDTYTGGSHLSCRQTEVGSSAPVSTGDVDRDETDKHERLALVPQARERRGGKGRQPHSTCTPHTCDCPAAPGALPTYRATHDPTNLQVVAHAGQQVNHALRHVHHAVGIARRRAAAEVWGVARAGGGWVSLECSALTLHHHIAMRSSAPKRQPGAPALLAPRHP